MNNKFRILVGLMILAMIGLITFQWYWIETGIKSKKEQFDRNVMEAMQTTIRKIERQEVIFLAKQHLKIQEEEKRLRALAENKPKVTRTKIAKNNPRKQTEINKPNDRINTLQPDSLMYAGGGGSTIFLPQGGDYTIRVNIQPDGYQTELSLMPEQGLQRIRKQLRRQQLQYEELNPRMQQQLINQQRIEDFFNQFDAQVLSMQNEINRMFPAPMYDFGRQPYFTVSYTTDRKSTPADRPTQNKEIPTKKQEMGTFTEKATSIKDKFQKTKDKADLVKDVFADFMRGERNIFERLNQTMLDTLLRAELVNRGITIPFEYGVKNNDKMLFTSYAVNYDPSLLDKAYNIRLFPNDAQPQNQYLYVYFTDKDDFVMSNMWSVFGSSFLLILMVGGIFYTSMATIMRQKKLSVIKNDFINNMTHEFKTPISTISLAIQVLKDKSIVKNEEKSDRYLGIIQNENRRLGTQVEKVLQMAQLDKGNVKLNFTEVNVHEVIEQVLANIGVQIEQKNGLVDLEIDAENAQVWADEVHLTNIIYNLLDNANKYSPESPQITIKTANTAEGLSIQIQDQGIGMSKEQTSKIFDKFYRIPTGNVHDVKGFGLGLSYVKKMVDWHNGTINVTSKLNEGTTFEIILPTG